MMTCKCISCVDCGGSGSVAYSFSGEYLGTKRCDDLDTFETCDECGGNGTSEVCEECSEFWEMEEQKSMEQESRK